MEVISYKSSSSSVIKHYDKNIFLKIADIYLEHNNQIQYVEYLNQLTMISKKIKSFYLNKISRVYSEVDINGNVTYNIDDIIFNNIKSLNNTIKEILSLFENNNYTSKKYNTDIIFTLKELYEIVEQYNFDYYQNYAYNEWDQLNNNIQTYLKINLNYFYNKEINKKKNPLKILLSSLSNESNTKNLKQITNQKYYSDSSIQKDESKLLLNELENDYEHDYKHYYEHDSENDSENTQFNNNNNNNKLFNIICVGLGVGGLFGALRLVPFIFL